MAKENGPEAAMPENGVSQEAPTLSQSDIGQSPILTVIRKRLRAANKRLKRIEDIEGARAAGKTLDADQEESLRSKSKVLANIEELERLQPLLREARNEDKSQIEAACKAQATSEAQAAAEEASASRIAELEASKQAAEQQAASARAEAEAAQSEVTELQSAAQGAQSAQGAEAAVHRLVELMYFATVFADDGAHHHEAERNACVSYDTYDFAGAQVEGRPLSEEDLKLVARLGNLLTQRPQGSRGQTMNHKDVIDSCAKAAMSFLHKSSDTIADLDTSAERVAEILDRVLSLDYATVTPEVQTAHQPEHEIAPHHHTDPAPAHNGFFEQSLQMSGMPYNVTEAPPHSYAPAPEPYAAMFQPPATEHSLQPAAQEAPQEKPYYDSAPPASLPIQFMTESTVEMEGGHPEPMGAAATEPMPSSTDARPPAQTILQSLQQGEAAPAAQAASGQAPPAGDGPRGFEGRGGGRYRGNARGGNFSRGSGRDEHGRGPPRGRGPPGRGASGDLGPRSASGDYRGGRGGGARRGGPRGGGRGGPTAQAVPQQA